MIKFIKRERIYIWMVMFILGINLLTIGYAHKKILPDKKSISSMTFKDIGITEEKIKAFFESKKPNAVFFKYSIIAGIFILVAGVTMNAAYLFGKKRLIPDMAPKRIPVPWGIADIARTCVIIVFSGHILGVTGSMILKQFHLDIDNNLYMIFSSFFMDIIAAAVILYFVLVKYRERLSSLGIKVNGFYKNILSGISAYIFTLPLLIVVFILSMLFLDYLGYKQPPQPVFDIFIEEKRNGAILFLAVFVSILGPVVEEIFFRGFLYSAVSKRFGILFGMILSAGLFSLLHANVAGFIPIMILGVLMAFLYETTGSLIASISVHIFHNSIIMCGVFFIKELLKSRVLAG